MKRWEKCEFVSGFVALVTTACVLNFHRAAGLLVISLVTVLFFVWDWMMERYGDRVWEELHPIRDLLNKNWIWIRRWDTRRCSNPVSVFPLHCVLCLLTDRGRPFRLYTTLMTKIKSNHVKSVSILKTLLRSLLCHAHMINKNTAAVGIHLSTPTFLVHFLKHSSGFLFLFFLFKQKNSSDTTDILSKVDPRSGAVRGFHP